MRFRWLLNWQRHRQAVVATLASALFLAGHTDAAFGADANSTESGNAEATLQRDGKGLFLTTKSRSFDIAQFALKGETKTVLVEGEVAHRLAVTDDLGAKGDETGTVSVTIRPIAADGKFGAPVATRALPGDEIKLESPAGINVITYGCCQENSAEELLSLASLKTVYVRSGGAPLTTYTRLGKPALGRIIALYLAMTPADDAVLGTDASAVGMITLAGEGEVMQRIRVHLRAAKAREAALEWSIEAGWKTSAAALENHTVIDAAKPSRPVFQWRIADGEVIALPLVDDRLDLGAATLPRNVTLEPLGPGEAPKKH